VHVDDYSAPTVVLPHHRADAHGGGGGDGWKAALRVRALHAKVRHALLSRREHDNWNVKDLGIPINQEDLAATLLGFSVNALLGIELVLGYAISKQERRDYLALWRYIGWLLDIDTIHDKDDEDYATMGNVAAALDPCGPGWYPKDRPDSLAHSHDLLQSIILHLMQPDDRSRMICHHLLRIGGSASTIETLTMDKKNDDDWWYLFRALRCRQYIGNPLADALQLPYHPMQFGRMQLWTCSLAYCCILRLWTLAGRPWSPLRSWLIGWHRQRLQTFYETWQEPHVTRTMQQQQQHSLNIVQIVRRQRWLLLVHLPWFRRC
jgi:ER-bound oxygenase mpaB/B'/Rubber oxygenase, catalytic domain